MASGKSAKISVSGTGVEVGEGKPFPMERWSDDWWVKEDGRSPGGWSGSRKRGDDEEEKEKTAHGQMSLVFFVESLILA